MDGAEINKSLLALKATASYAGACLPAALLVLGMGPHSSNTCENKSSRAGVHPGPGSAAGPHTVSRLQIDTGSTAKRSQP